MEEGCTALKLVVGGLSSSALLEHILSFLPAPSVVATVSTTKFWCSAAVSNSVWHVLCECLWADKVYVPETFKATGPEGMSRIAAYWGSLADAKRDTISEEELCSFDWSCRMKGWAGSDWTENDPWWRGEPASIRRYNRDGTSTSSQRGEGKWRFVPSACGRSGGIGRFIRHSRGGRDFPTHLISRWEANWGFIMQNCWGFHASFPLPPRGQELLLEDEGVICQSVTVENCREEAMRFNMGLPLPYEVRPGSDSEDGTTDDAEYSSNIPIQVDGQLVQMTQRQLMALLLEAQRAGIPIADDSPIDIDSSESDVD